MVEIVDELKAKMAKIDGKVEKLEPCDLVESIS